MNIGLLFGGTSYQYQYKDNFDVINLEIVSREFINESIFET